MFLLRTNQSRIAPFDSEEDVLYKRNPRRSLHTGFVDS